GPYVPATDHAAPPPAFPTRRSSDLTRACGGTRAKSSPSSTIRPAATGSAPERARRSVVLPAPFGPITPTYSPRATVRETPRSARSEEHTSELQSRGHLVCRLLLEKK